MPRLNWDFNKRLSFGELEVLVSNFQKSAYNVTKDLGALFFKCRPTKEQALDFGLEYIEELRSWLIKFVNDLYDNGSKPT